MRVLSCSSWLALTEMLLLCASVEVAGGVGATSMRASTEAADAGATGSRPRPAEASDSHASGRPRPLAVQRVGAFSAQEMADILDVERQVRRDSAR